MNCVLALQYYNKCWRQSIYKEERFVLVHSFGGFSAWLIFSIDFGPVVRQNIIVEQRCLSHVQRWKRGRGRGRILISPSKLCPQWLIFLPPFFFFCHAGCVLARQSLYHLSHASSPSFFSGGFGERVLLFAQARSDQDPPILGFPQFLGWNCAQPCPAFFFSLRVSLANFLPRLAWNGEPSNLSLLSSYDYRHGPLLLG
jgi:hypothetical protein